MPFPNLPIVLERVPNVGIAILHREYLSLLKEADEHVLVLRGDSPKHTRLVLLEPLSIRSDFCALRIARVEQHCIDRFDIFGERCTSPHRVRPTMEALCK